MAVIPATAERRRLGPARQEPAADRFMRRLLRVTVVERSIEAERAAHRGFRVSMVVSGIRCLVTYLLVPVLAPVVSFAGIVAAPIGILLCIVAGISGIASVRRFWSSDHRGRWMYTAFIAFVFLVLAVALSSDIAGLVRSL